MVDGVAKCADSYRIIWLAGRWRVGVVFALYTVGKRRSGLSGRQSVRGWILLGGIVDRCTLHRFHSAWCPYPSARGSRVRTKPECFVWPPTRN